MHGLLGHPNLFLFVFIEDYSHSVSFSTRFDFAVFTLQSDFLGDLSMIWCYTGQWLLHFRPFVWDLPMSMLPADIRPHLAVIVHGPQYLLTLRHILMML